MFSLNFVCIYKSLAKLGFIFWTFTYNPARVLAAIIIMNNVKVSKRSKCSTYNYTCVYKNTKSVINTGAIRCKSKK